MPTGHTEIPTLPPDRTRPRGAVALAALLVAGACLLPETTGSAVAGPPPQRTVRIRHTGQPNGNSGSPVISGDGRYIAFSSQATNLGGGNVAGGTANAFLYNQDTGAITLLSAAPGGQAANGPSTDPAVATGARVVAFTSHAGNLVPGDAGARSEVLAWTPSAGLQRVSAPLGAGQPSGDSGEADISADGRAVVFSSTATNLVADPTNGHRNVFVRDLLLRRTFLVSAGRAGAPADGDSSAPSISPDGRYVSYSTAATNILPGGPYASPQVVLRDLVTGATQVVSVASNGQPQNAAVKAPFSQLSDVSAGGRSVVFDSDASNLVAADRNHHTDVFVRDTVAGKTSRVSLATTDQQADSDSFAPRISADGRYVTFESFAANLTPYVPAGGNVFVRDLLRHTTVMADVSSRGRPRSAEHVKELLQRPSISDDGSTAVFVSTATNLVAGASGSFANVFLRRLLPAPITVAAPSASLVRGRVAISFRSGDRQAGPLLCRLDRRPVALCPLGRTVLPRLRGGRHVLRAFAGGQGTAYALAPIVVRVDIRRGRPTVKIVNPGRGLGLGG